MNWSQIFRFDVIGRVAFYALGLVAAISVMTVASAPIASSAPYRGIVADRAASDLDSGPEDSLDPILIHSVGTPPWSPEWLSNKLLGTVDRVAGPLGLRVLSGAVSGTLFLILWLLVRRRRRRRFASALALLVAALLLLSFLSPSPALLGLPLFVAGAHLLTDFHRYQHWAVLVSVPFGSALLANLHPEMAWSLAMLFLLLVLLWVPRAFVPVRNRGEGDPERPVDVPIGPEWYGRCLLLAGGVVLGALATPWHIHLPFHLWNRWTLQPLMPPLLDAGPIPPLALTWSQVVAVAGIGLLLAMNLAAWTLGQHGGPRKPPAFSLIFVSILAAVFAGLSVPFLWLLLVPLLAALHPDSSLSVSSSPDRAGAATTRQHSLRAAIVSIFLVALLLEPRVQATLEMLREGSPYREAVNPTSLPVDASRFLREIGLGGNILAEPDWSGYLSYELEQARFLADPRRALLSPEAFATARGALEGKPESLAELAAYDIDLLILRAGRPVPRDGRWARIFRNRTADVWLRRSPRTLRGFVSASRYYMLQSLPRNLAEGFDESVIVEANPGWAREFRILPEAIELPVLQAYDELRRQEDRSSWVARLRELGNLFATQGLYRAALREWERALQIRERDRNLLYNIGVARLRLDRLEEARRSFQSYHVLYPEDEEALRILEALDQELAY